jgi:hypothetical protein
MRRRQHRHPYIETAVFAAALLLAAFIARELWSRRSPSVPPAGTSSALDPAAQHPTVLHPTRPPLPPLVKTNRTEQAVTGVAPIKLTRVQRRKPKAAVVPAPK